ncbi:hypothetical protein AB5J62_00370 [Amycolatopsis sp. cg5]|uniref:hypothetical protein n=1 Tax=Amycolatopsis sp. cg5 TaxID=3238802 RepID=UPI0035245BE7
MSKHGSTGGSHHTSTGSHHTSTSGSHSPSPAHHTSDGSSSHHESKPNTGHGDGQHFTGTSAGGKGHRLNTESLGTMEGHIGRTRDKVDGVGRKVGAANFGHESMGVIGTGMTGSLNSTVDAAKAQVAKTSKSVDAAALKTKAAKQHYETNELNTVDALNKTGKSVKAPPVKEGSTTPSSAGSTAPPAPKSAGGSPPDNPPPGGPPPPGGGDSGGHRPPGGDGAGPQGPPPGPKSWRQSMEEHFTPHEMKELDRAFEKGTADPTKGQVPGSGQLTPRERDLVARAQALVDIHPDTTMQKVIPPGALDRYLDNEVTPSGDRRFNSNQVGGFVARAQDATHMRTPEEIIQGNRLDYQNTPFKPDKLDVVHVMEFPAGDSTYKTPFGAPYAGGSGTHANWESVREARAGMVDAADSAGFTPKNSESMVSKWPFSGFGMTADAHNGVPERIRPYADIEPGSTIYEYDRAGNKRPVARYWGQDLGWEDLR